MPEPPNAPSNPAGRASPVTTAVEAAPLSTCLASFAVGAGIGALAVYALRRDNTGSSPFWSRVGEQAWNVFVSVLPEGVQDTMDAANDWRKTRGA